MWPGLARATKCPPEQLQKLGARPLHRSSLIATNSEDNLESAGSTHARANRYFNDLPASGAWKDGDPPGERRFFRWDTGRPFLLEAGGSLNELVVAYETWGELTPDTSNAVLICHALTGDSHVCSSADRPGSPDGWWEEMVGPGKFLDTERYFVVCSNVLGGCQGTTGPASVNPDKSRPWGAGFPAVTIRDMVRIQKRLTDHLGVRQWLSVIGGSMGGMQVLEWGAMFPERVRSLAPLAVGCSASPWQIAWSKIGRTAIALDPAWRGGDYYDAPPGFGPQSGLALARATAQITYRSDPLFQDRWGRRLLDPSEEFGLWDRYSVESYLDYHGEKLVNRFDANSYLLLNKAMDSHDLGRGRGGLEKGVKLISAPVLTVAISSDVLYPPRQQRELRDLLRASGGECEFVFVPSEEGHDGFLLEIDAVGGALADFLSRVAI